MVLQEHLDALCPELRAVVADAERSGNPAVETWRGFGNGVRLQRARPVLAGIEGSMKARLLYRPVDDPHYWQGELHCRDHGEWFIALPFEPGEHADLGLDRLAQDPR
jgi:hypothetical protein